MNLRLALLFRDAQVIARGYSTVIFSSNSGVGFLLIAATLWNPQIGLTGIFGTLIALIAARWIGFDTRSILDGRLLFNSLLSSLAVGCWLPWGMVSMVFYGTLLLVVSILTLMVTVVINHYSFTLNQAPSMSLPFCVVATLLHWFVSGQGLFFPEHANPATVMGPWADLWIHSIGVLFFSPLGAGGIFITIALFLASRLSFLHAVTGFAVSVLLIHGLGQASENYAWLHANCILTAVALGGIFFIPSRGALLLTVLGSALCAFVGMALLHVFIFINTPVLTLPFNLTTLAVVVAMRWRSPRKMPYAVTIPGNSPEATARENQLLNARLTDAEIPSITLPFDGEWVVTQGFHGRPTHFAAWACALDFEIATASHVACRPASSVPADFPSFNAPIIAPADGKVVRVVEGIPDNPIGENNFSENWGNSIVIEIASGLYVQLSHLRQHGVKVREGDYVRRGQLIAYLGNSGRSPVPHLHLQMQNFPEIGSSTIPFRLHGYRVATKNGKWAYNFRGLPKEGEAIAGCRSRKWLGTLYTPFIENKTRYHVLAPEGEKEENIVRTVEAGGVICWKSAEHGATLHAGIQYGVLVPLEYLGSRKSLLYLLWAAGRIPLCDRSGICWEETGDSTFGKNIFERAIKDFLAPFQFFDPPVIHGKVLRCDGREKIYNVQCVIEASGKNSVPTTMEFRFGEGLQLLSVRKLSEPEEETYLIAFDAGSQQEESAIRKLSQAGEEAPTGHESHNPAGHSRVPPLPELPSRYF